MTPGVRRSTRSRPAATAAALLLVAVAGCEGNDIVAPELLEDVAGAVTYYPSRQEWESRPPAEVGMDPAALDAAVAFARDNEADTPTDLRAYLESRFEGLPDQQILGPTKERGPMSGVVVKDGYLVAEWGDTERVDMTFSVTKSFLSTVVGLAVDRGLIGGVHDPIAETVRDGGYDSPQNAPITWHMALRQTAEWEGTLWDKPDTADRREGRDRELQAPGTFWEYNDVRVNRLALSALRVWGEPLPDVLEREIMSPIGASRSWRWHGYRNSHVTIDGTEMESVSGGGHWGGGMWISTRDLARFGYLFLRRGLWRDKQLISEQWVDMATAPGDVNPTYGYMWWINAGGELWPAAPEEAYAARGGGDNLVYVDPVHDLVVVVRWIQRGTEADFIRHVLAAAGGAAGE